MINIININNFNIQLTEEEQAAYAFLKQNYPQLLGDFKDNLLASRDKISQRLIISSYRENLVNAKDNSLIMSVSKLDRLPIDKDEDVLCIHFPKAKKYIYGKVEGRHAFGRVDVVGPFFESKEEQSEFTRVMHPLEVLDNILIEDPTLNNEASDQFKDDLDNSVANMALALAYQAYHMRDMNKPLLDIISTHEDSYLRSEQAVIEGHPLHPGAKLRKGLSAQENIYYSSEYGKEIHLKCVLIHESIANTQALSNSYNNEIESILPELYAQISKELDESINLSQYHLMIVHPWQYDYILKVQYQSELEQQLIIPLNMSLPYYAGLSFRTLMPKYPKQLPHIKLSTNVHITGEIRTLSEQTTHNGPLVTKILNDILNNDSVFHEYRIKILDELAGIHFYNINDPEDIQTDRSEQLGTLFRENIYQLIANDSIPMIPSSLVANYKYNEETPIVSLIQLFRQSEGIDSFEEAAQLWLRDYSTQLLGIVLPLYIKYGIALEAHLQNSIALFNKDGSLNTIYIRDFEGLRIDEAQLNASGYATDDFHEKSRILTDSKTSVFNKAFYSTVQNHLGELVLTVAKVIEDTSFEETMWRQISDIIQQILVDLNDVEEERLNTISSTLFAETIDYKCVTTMRLEDEAHHYTYIKVDNPLHR
ncbi:sialic acid synthase [Staphylococcus pragensis]|uniref:Sialic acid synthase n=1 Tax=Staphylococcus pragensis TaxID=1611836 RepID=A0A4Z1BRZ9_9STAP|nr:IucA/IucC family protein [Staphylococcus pragensis]RTX89210.1 sialic acid synthase [Staphylococcus carnosus]TGN27719.1 sialic acid synthase [Staphylococcus pragensis]GGG90555.1 siderophore biosynthesis protein, IucA/IucC family [Staphylococcus pragensis]